MSAARASLEWRLEHGGGHTGWSRAWIIGLWAHFREGEKACENFMALLSESTFPNLMDHHPMGNDFVFQIDGNLGAGAALIEMLVQSVPGRVYLLPAMPERLSEGCIEGVCLRGGAELSMEWKDGRVIRLRVTALEDYQAEVWEERNVWKIKLARGENIFLEGRFYQW